MARLVWQPYEVERGHIIDGTVYAEPLEDLAVLARIGGRMLCHWPHARVWTTETLELAARVVAGKPARPNLVPLSVFDWPIYRAAMAPTPSDEWLAARTADDWLVDQLRARARRDA